MSFFKKQTYPDPLSDVKENVIASITRALEPLTRIHTPLPHELEVPPNPALGDLALGCFALAQALKKSPNDIAHRLQKNLEQQLTPEQKSPIERVAASGPYLNIFISRTHLAKTLLPAIMTSKRFGCSSIGNKKKILIEYVSPNTNKPLHLGHARNGIYGDSVARLLSFCGYAVKRVNYTNDRGIHICKSMVAYRRALKNKQLLHSGKNPREARIKGDHFVGDYYVLYDTVQKKDPSIEEEVRACLAAWEARESTTRALWKQMNRWALTGMDETYKRLGLFFDTIYFDSSFYLKGKKIIERGINEGVFHRDASNAIIADLSSFDLPDKVLLRGDGTSLYITPDIYLAYLKYKDFRPDSSLYVIGSEQNLYLRQLFAILTLLKFPSTATLHHLSYGMVRLPEGKMKSREGTVVDTDDILNELEALAIAEVHTRDTLLKPQEEQKRARAIAHAALRFFMLSVSPASDITFNPKETIAFQGKTGPYLLYTYARLRSISRKKLPYRKITTDFFRTYTWDAEHTLLMHAGLFPSIVRQAAADYNPAHLAQYLFTLAQLTNDYYHTTPVLQADERTRSARLYLVESIARILKNGLGLLGIETIERM